jgi:hypothetical protein
MAMFSMLFAGSSETLMTLPDADPMLRSANIMMLFAVMHLLLGAVMVAAPFIANALVTNASAASGVVMPFVGAAVGAAAGTAAAGHAAARNGYGSLQRLTGNSTVTKSGPTPRMSGSGMPPASTPMSAAASNLSTSGSDAGGSDISGTPPAPAPDAAQQQKRQQRRGTIIRQQLKSRGKV